MERWLQFSVLPGRRNRWGFSLLLPITGLQSHGPSCPLLQPGDLQTPGSESSQQQCDARHHEMGWITVSRTSLQGFLSSLVLMAEVSPASATWTAQETGWPCGHGALQGLFLTGFIIILQMTLLYSWQLKYLRVSSQHSMALAHL